MPNSFSNDTELSSCRMSYCVSMQHAMHFPYEVFATKACQRCLSSRCHFYNTHPIRSSILLLSHKFILRESHTSKSHRPSLIMSLEAHIPNLAHVPTKHVTTKIVESHSLSKINVFHMYKLKRGRKYKHRVDWSKNYTRRLAVISPLKRKISVVRTKL